MNHKTAYRLRGIRRNRPPGQSTQLLIAWANLHCSAPIHSAFLNNAFEQKIDVLCIQEPWIQDNSRTITHGGFEIAAPTDTWDREQGPRALIYIRKNASRNASQRRPLQTRDLVWMEIEGYTIINVYRQQHTHNVFDYITHLNPPENCIIGGDFNAHHHSFDPGVETYNGGQKLAKWALDSSMNYLGTPGTPTHIDGHVLDLIFSNIPFAQSIIRHDLHCGSDHEVLVSTIHRSHSSPPEATKPRVPEKELGKFNGLMLVGLSYLKDFGSLGTSDLIDKYLDAISNVFANAIFTAGNNNHANRHSSQEWWTHECQTARARHLANPNRSHGITLEQKEYMSIIRQARKNYWNRVIDNAKDDKDLYRIIGWHKLVPNLKSPPLRVEGRTIEDITQKAEALRAGILDRFSAADDLPYDPLDTFVGLGQLGWDRTISIEEVERYTIGVSCTSPGTDGISVKLLKACWEHIGPHIHKIFSACLRFNHFPALWKQAEIAMLPKVGKKDKSSIRSWRPIALLSCLGKGFERLIAQRISWTALTSGLLSPQHAGALPKRSATDLTAALTHDIQLALAHKKVATMVTLDVQGAFDALLPRRLLERMMKQGWPVTLLELIRSFLTNRQIRVRLESATTPFHKVACGTPQGSPLSPILYMLYLSTLLSQDTRLRFGYADDICIYRIGRTLSQTTDRIAQDVRDILTWGDTNKIAFAPDKLELIHFSRKRNKDNPICKINDTLSISPVPLTDSTNRKAQQQALRWLGIWFDRTLNFKRHVEERALKATKIAYHIRSLGKIKNGPPAKALRKALITCVLPSLLYGSEIWFSGRRKSVTSSHDPTANTVSTKLGGHIDRCNKVCLQAARGVLPAWRTTPTAILLSEAGLPSAAVALEQARLQFAMRLQTVDPQHPLVNRIEPEGTQRYPIYHTTVQRIGKILPKVPRPTIRRPHFTTGCRIDPTEGIVKEQAASDFKDWWFLIPGDEITIFSDGSESFKDKQHLVGYGFAVYLGNLLLCTGKGSINPLSHVFDAEIIGAWMGLQRVINDPAHQHRKIWMCIDSTSVIWCLRANASQTSQWAFHKCHDAMRSHDIKVKWSPGHCDIQGNELADKLAKEGAKLSCTDPEANRITISGLGTIKRQLMSNHIADWWLTNSRTLSALFTRWSPIYELKASPFLSLPRLALHRWLALRSGHGDFAWYHRRFNHEGATLTCHCSRDLSPLHIVRCSASRACHKYWPSRPTQPPTSDTEAIEYLRSLKPEEFRKLLHITGNYS